MNDLIDRQAAIEAIQEHKKNVLESYEYNNEGIAIGYSTAHRHICNVIERLPTIERKTGKWIRIVKHHKDDEQEYDYYEISCSECGARRKIGWHDARFCPNCGAEML